MKEKKQHKCRGQGRLPGSSRGGFYFVIAFFLLLLGAAGCGHGIGPEMRGEGKTPIEEQSPSNGNDFAENDAEEVEEIKKICGAVYEAAEKTKTTDGLETVKTIVNRLGRAGYAAVDSENQINMAGAERVLWFCGQVAEKAGAELTIIQVSHSGGFIKYDLQTKDGEVTVNRGYYPYENGQIKNGSKNSYPVRFWQYTQEGYLLFEGSWHSEDAYVLSLSEGREHVALRVLPLDEKYRELNRRYILPVGYERNNLFLFDWKEGKFGELNFYDAYDICYPMVKGAPVPYGMDDNLGVGAVYRIPEKEFEAVIMRYFKIDSETLRKKTTYLSEEAAYEYKPRGFYEGEYPEHPYPEVVGCAENGDGTIALTVNVVFPYQNSSRVYAHEVVIRPLADGGFQYVSNRIIPSQDNGEETWHTPRLTEEEWETWYGLPVSGDEREEAETECGRAMNRIADIYAVADKGEASNVVLSGETVAQMVARLKETAYTVISMEPYSDMENFEEMDRFLKKAAAGEPGEMVVYEVHSDGALCRNKYTFDGTDMYMLSAGTAWDAEGKAHIVYLSHTRINQWEYTQKGWFCYELRTPQPPAVTEIVDGSRMMRVLPLDDACRQASLKYVAALDYQGNNLLCTDWDAAHMEDLDYNGIYEYLYQMEHKKKMDYENYVNGIPKKEFETLLMAYLPVTPEQLEKYAAYDTKKQTYVWQPLGCLNYNPTVLGTAVPEVTNIKENADGTITLTVDALCEMLVHEEAAMTHELTVRILEDGSFQYLGNKIREPEPLNGG